MACQATIIYKDNSEEEYFYIPFSGNFIGIMDIKTFTSGRTIIRFSPENFRLIAHKLNQKGKHDHVSIDSTNFVCNLLSRKELVFEDKIIDIIILSHFLEGEKSIVSKLRKLPLT
jgi:hypothetical protein